MTEATREVRRSPEHPDFPDDLKEKIRAKNRARRQWQRHFDVVARSTMHRLVREIREELRELRNERWGDMVESLQAQDLSLWRMARILRGGARQPLPKLQSAAGWLYSDEEKAEEFANQLQQQCSLNDPTCDPLHVQRVEDAVAAFRESAAEDHQYVPLSADDVASAIKTLPLRKAPGPDGIPNIALRHLQRKGRAAILNIFSAALRLRHFPALWKEADVVMIPKQGKSRTTIEGYRPISLLSTIGKLFERVIQLRLQQWVDESGLIPDEQHGFRRHHSTLHQLLRVAEYISQSFNWSGTVCALFLDVAKAFDKVWHQGLIYKLSNANAPTWLVRLLDSYLSGRRFRIKIGDVRSSARPIAAGVPQGSVLAPLLFNVYSADMPCPPPNVVHAQYADDTAILSRSKRPALATRRLQEAAARIEDWYCAWRINVNPSKSVAVQFTRKRQPADLPMVKLFGTDVPWQPQVKYLGVTMDSRLTWRRHVADANRKARGAMAFLSGLTCRRSKLSLGNKLLLYRAVVRPMMTYAAPIWGYAGSRVLAPLQVTQNLFLRTACDAPWYIRNVDIRADLRTETVEEFVKKLAERFFTSVVNHSNAGISGAGADYCAEDGFRYGRPKHILRGISPASSQH